MPFTALTCVTLQLNYTYSHALDEISNGGFNGFSSNSVFPSDSANLHQNYGNADYDVRHYVSGNYVFNLPSWRGPRILTAGWQAAGTVFHSTGLPFTFTDNITASNLPNHTGPIFAQQTVAHVSDRGALAMLITHGANCAASLDFTTATDFGQQERNQVFGPNYTDTDLTITKAFDLHFMESAKLKLRCSDVQPLQSPQLRPALARRRCVHLHRAEPLRWFVHRHDQGHRQPSNLHPWILPWWRCFAPSHPGQSELQLLTANEYEQRK